MAVVYEDIGGGKVKAYSDAGKMIHGGFPEGDYAVAFDPAAAGRTYTETDQFVPTDIVSGRKRYSVYRLILGLKELGVLAPVVKWVKANNLYEELVTVGVVDGEDDDLMAALRELGASLGVTTEQIDALLASAEAR